MPVKSRKSKEKAFRDGRKLGVDKLVERVFIHNPRTLSFSHRSLGSLRHPYTSLISSSASLFTSPKRKITYLLEALFDAKGGKELWVRVERIFDCMLGDSIMEKMKLDVLLSSQLLERFEVLWTRLGVVSGGKMSEDVYKQFQQQLYFILLEVEDMSILPATSQFILEDFQYDSQGKGGVEFSGFANSMLELVDNWTPTREAADFVAFVDRIIECHAPNPEHSRTAKPSNEFTLSKEAFFRAGVVVAREKNDKTVYFRTTL